MHRLPHRPGFYVFGLQCQPDLLAVGIKFLGRNQYHRQPAVGPLIRSFGHKFDAGNILQSILIISKDLAFTCNPIIEHPELSAPDDRQSIAHTIDEYAFRFNRRTSVSRGKLFYRLIQQAAATDHFFQKIFTGVSLTQTQFTTDIGYTIYGVHWSHVHTHILLFLPIQHS